MRWASVPGRTVHGWAPSRIVPPKFELASRFSTTPSWFCHSVMSATTGCGVSTSNSVELALARPTTLRAAFDWSWELLTAPDKAALAQLSVFEGGFTLEAAEGLLDMSAFGAAPWPTDVVQSLVEKSFVRRLGDGRFDLLVSMQDYAAEHLRTPEHFVGSGPQALAAAQARHAAYFAALGEQRAVAGGCAEVDNLVVACRRAASVVRGYRLVGADDVPAPRHRRGGGMDSGVGVCLSVARRCR